MEFEAVAAVVPAVPQPHISPEVRRVLAARRPRVHLDQQLGELARRRVARARWQSRPMHVSDDLIVANPHNPECGQPHADEGRTHSRLFTGRAPGERCAHHGLEGISLRTAGYYALPPRLAGVPIRLDPLHGAFLVGMFEVRRRQGVT